MECEQQQHMMDTNPLGDSLGRLEQELMLSLLNDLEVPQPPLHQPQHLPSEPPPLALALPPLHQPPLHFSCCSSSSPSVILPSSPDNVTPDDILYPLSHATASFPAAYDPESPSFQVYFGQPGIPPGPLPVALPVEIKTEGGSSEESEELSCPNKRKRKKEECLSVEEKAKLRAKQCRKASRRYRQRKKHLMEELEQKVAVLMKEKEEILREKEAAVKLAQQLTRENSSLKERQKQEALEVEQLRQRYLIALDEKIREIPPVPDSEIAEILNKMRECCTRINGIGQCHLEMLLTMDVAKQLSTVGFFGSDRAKVELAEFPESIATFARKVLTEVHTLNNEQRQHIQECLDAHYLALERIRHIREELNADLSNFLNSMQPRSPEENMPITISSLATLEYLRENMRAESQQYEDTMDRMMYVLTPRQQAQFYLRVEFQHGAVIQLKNVWEAVKNSPAGGDPMKS